MVQKFLLADPFAVQGLFTHEICAKLGKRSANDQMR